MTRKSKPASDSLRVDRWLFYCRFFKTRGKATTAVTGGHVRLNGERTTAGSKVKRGDRIELVRDRLPYSLEVIDIPMRRGPAARPFARTACSCQKLTAGPTSTRAANSGNATERDNELPGRGTTSQTERSNQSP
jgi:ribosome-associated heat shock protein Hsp15